MYQLLFKNYGVKSGNAAQNYFMLVAKGLASNQNVKVHVNSLLPVNSKDQGKKIWINRNEVEQGISYSYIPIINIPIIRNICSSIYLFFKVNNG